MSDRRFPRLRAAGRRLVPEFVRRRYAAQFAIGFLAVVVVIAGVGAFAYVETGNAIQSDTEAQLERTSGLQADAIGSWMGQMRTHTRSVSSGDALKQDRTAAAYILLQDQLLPDDIVGMHLVNQSQGEVVASTELPLEGRSLNDLSAPWTTALVPEGPGQNDRVWSSDRSYRSPVLNDRPVMAFASSVPQHDGTYLVVVTRIQSQLDRIQSANASQRTTIVNDGGETVLDIDRTFDQSAHESAVSKIRSENATATTATRVGDSRLYAYATVPGTDWVAVTSVAKSNAFAVRNTVGQTVGLLVLLALLSLGVVGVVLGKRTISPISRLRDRAERIESGEFDVDLDTHRVDEIGRLFDSFDGMRGSLRDRISEAERAQAEAEEAKADAEAAKADAEQAREEAEAVTRKLQARASEYSDVMRAVAEGDLTRRLDEDADQAAMRDVATEFNAMIDQLEATVARVASFSDEVATASTEVATGAEEIETTSQTVSERIQEIADGAVRQHDDLQSAAAEMDELSASIEEVAASSATVAETADEAVDRGETGRAAAESAIEEMNDIEDRSEDAVEQMLALKDRVDEIGEIVDFVTDVAEQTNLLALNANIEAARADGDGDGFAVVADEVKDLAEETKDAAADIEELIRDVETETDETVEDIRATSDRIQSGTETVRAAADAIEDTVDAVEEASHGIQEISDATDDQADATQRVVGRVDDVSQVSKTVTEEAEQVSAAAEEQSASTAEIARSADELRQRADALSGSVDEFDVDRSEDAADAGVDEESAATDD